MRIYELARELELESKDVLTKAQELGVEVKTASSGVDEDEAEMIRLSFDGNGSAPQAPAPEESDPEASVLEAATPEPVEPDESEPAVEEQTETEGAAVPEAEVSEGPTEADNDTDTAVEDDISIAEVEAGLTVAEFAEVVGAEPTDIVKNLIGRGLPIAVDHTMPTDLIEEIGETFGVIVEVKEPEPLEEQKPERPTFDDAEADLEYRPPVVTVMGHVDHGKTTLLDTIRQEKVVDTEEGGITQHIGAYQVEVDGRKITFIDTPGHEAFTALRSRGADLTDIVVLVVAADDGVMPQTSEAISHSKAADVRIIVAINKMDVPGADPLKVRTELTEHGVITEELGGDVPSIEVSALTGDGVDDLLEMIDLVAQLGDFKANPKPAASGIVVEAQIELGRGPVATVIVQRGTLKQSDAFVAGPVSGRARAMMDDTGNRLKNAGPSTPVQIMGWSEVPAAGDYLEVVKNDKAARALADERAEKIRSEEQVVLTGRDRLESLLEQLRTDEATLRLIIKADAQGSLEALRESIGKIEREGGRIEVIHGAVGGVNENDVTLAEVTESVIVGFNVRPEPKARKAAEQAGIEIRTYGVIYELLNEVEQLLVGELAPIEEEVVLGTAEVRALFKVPRAGTIAGSYVTEGVIQRGAKARLLRAGVVIHDGVISSLKRFKDDVREVASGFECGIGIEGYNDLKEEDLIEAYEIREVART
ncbi:MAG: translation initiation factor IF-2 [Acidimicrobiia bacterium]|nr:translation initiation factor IF-2 [Acidimicrobiia bacterium]